MYDQDSYPAAGADPAVGADSAVKAEGNPDECFEAEQTEEAKEMVQPRAAEQPRAAVQPDAEQPRAAVQPDAEQQPMPQQAPEAVYGEQTGSFTAAYRQSREEHTEESAQSSASEQETSDRQTSAPEQREYRERSNEQNSAQNGYHQEPGGNGGNMFYNTYIPSQPEPAPVKEKKERKAGAVLRKAVACVSLGLFFGLFAGLGFYAVVQTTGMNPTGESKEVAVNGGVGESGVNAEIKGELPEETKSGIKLTDTDNVRVVSSDVTEVVEEVMPAMVSIINNFTQTGTTIFGQNYSQDVAASGTGIIVAESESELLIVSNHHVVADATQLDVTFIDGTVAQAQIKGMDSDMDLAVIAIPLEALSEETKSAIAIATLGDSDSLTLGEPVVAIGNALGYGQSVTNGIVSALNREISMEDGSTGTFIQTNAAINPGNSGGALVNVNGEVIGINSNKIGGSAIEGMGYAIPISAAKPIITDLMMKETRTKVEADQAGYMGITMNSLSEQFSVMYRIPQGVYVISVEDGYPAKEAGLLPGDIIVKFEGEKITTAEDLQDVLQYFGAGDTVSMIVKRPENGEYKDVEITLTLAGRPAE